MGAGGASNLWAPFSPKGTSACQWGGGGGSWNLQGFLGLLAPTVSRPLAGSDEYNDFRVKQFWWGVKDNRKASVCVAFGASTTGNPVDSPPPKEAQLAEGVLP